MRTPFDPEHARTVISDLAATDGAMLPILHALQATFGYLPRACEPLIADALNISRADVRGVVSFYHDFRDAPPGRHVLKLCRAEACQATGATALADRVLAALGVTWGGTTEDGALTVEPSYCLGLCACGPAALLDDEPVGRLDPARLDALLASAA